MKNVLKFVTFIALFLLLALPVQAQNFAGQSAQVLKLEARNFDAIRLTKKKMAIYSLLEKHNSPLLASTDSFLQTCSTYELDCFLLPSITGLESGFGKHIYPGSYNPFGWGGGYILFKDWDQAIKTVGNGLKTNYIAKGADTVEEIAPIYAESKTWAPRVQYFMNAFENEQAKIEEILEQNIVQL